MTATLSSPDFAATTARARSLRYAATRARAGSDAEPGVVNRIMRLLSWMLPLAVLLWLVLRFVTHRAAR